MKTRMQCSGKATVTAPCNLRHSVVAMHLYNALSLVHSALPYNMWSANWTSKHYNLSCAAVLLSPSYEVHADDAWAARYNSWLLIELVPKGITFSVFLVFHTG